MKRTIAAITLIFFTLFLYTGWVDVETPESIDDLRGDLAHQVVAYEVIDGTPLIVAQFGDAVFLDKLEMRRYSKEFPPYPIWQWTGMWERDLDPKASATAHLTSEFGPTVLFGLVNDDSITELQIVRGGVAIRTISVSGPAFIVETPEVRLTDTVVFMDADGAVVVRASLMPTAHKDS